MNLLLKSLKQGDTIGIIAPASPVTTDELEPAINIIKQEGYRVIEGDHIYDTQGYLAGRDEDRLYDLHEMFLNSDVKAVICARGGYGTPRLLDKIDYNIIRDNPKLFIGYSERGYREDHAIDLVLHNGSKKGRMNKSDHINRI